ncbi:unnamed protein product, partial [Adineta ricciae]
KYPRREMLNDEPVVVYLIRLTKLLRYELLRMSTVNLKDLKIELNKTVRNTLRPNASQIQSISDDWRKEIDLLLLQRKKIKESWLDKIRTAYKFRVQTIEEENARKKKEHDLACRQVEERIQRTKQLSSDIFNDIKLIGQLLHESKFASSKFEIDNVDTLLGETVQLVRRLLKIQETIPKECRLDDDKEGKELMNMISIESIRIEVKEVCYGNVKPDHFRRVWYKADDWDNQIRLVLEAEDKKEIEGIVKPLNHTHWSKTVNNLFSHSIPISFDGISTEARQFWYLELRAGEESKNKWTKMTRKRLHVLESPFYDQKTESYNFGYLDGGIISVQFTPNINIGIFQVSAEDAFKMTIGPDTTTEGTVIVISEDRSLTLTLRLEYQNLSCFERRRKLEKWLIELRSKCEDIERKKPYDFEMPREPVAKEIPPPETTENLPEIGMRADIRNLDVLTPPTHHCLMTQLPPKHEQLDKIITQTIDNLNKSISDDELNKIQDGIVRRFDSADNLKQGIKVFKETFRFDKLLSTLLHLHKISIETQKSLRSGKEYEERLKSICDDLIRHSFLIRLSENEGTISRESIEKLYTSEMKTLLQEASSLAKKELTFGILVYCYLISTELNLIQLIVYSLETKEHAEQALQEIEIIKQYCLDKTQQIFIDDKQIDSCRRILQDTINQIHERKKQIRTTVHQPTRLANLNEISKAINVKSLLKSTGSPFMNKITIDKQDGEYFPSQTSIIIQFEQIIQNWSYAQLKTKALELVNNTDDELDFELLSVTQERSLSVFTVQSSSSTIEPHDSKTLKILPKSEVGEGKYREEWKLQLANKRLSIGVKLCCEIKQFFVGIDLPLMTTRSADEEIKTYEINFGTVLACPRAQRSRSFTIENPMSLDLRVKLRREEGATGKFEIDKADFHLFAYESKEMTIDWHILDVIQDSKCVYEIYFSKDLKYRIICLGKIRKICYDILYKSIHLSEKQYRSELPACLPDTIHYEELTIHNTGEVKMTIESKAENKSTDAVTISLSHNQVVLEPNALAVLKIELQMNKPHGSLENIVNLNFPDSTQRSAFKFILKTSAGWPELDQDLLKPLKMLKVEENANEETGQIVLFNKGLVEMLIDKFHSTSSHVSIEYSNPYPHSILPRQRIEYDFVYKVLKKLPSFDCEFVLHTNCKESTQRIPFHCKRLAPIIAIDQNVLHCGTTHPLAKHSFEIKMKNDGHARGILECEPYENDNVISFRVSNDTKSVPIAALDSRKIKCIVEIKKAAPLGDFKIDIPLVVSSSTGLPKKYKLVVTGRTKPKDESKGSSSLIDLPSSSQQIAQSTTGKRLMSLLEDETYAYRRRAATAIAPIITQLDELIHHEPKPSDIPDNLTCDEILSELESDEREISSYTEKVQESVK